MQPTTRRRFLSSLGGPAALGLAGCTGTTQLDDLKSRLNAANEREQRLEKELAKTRAELNETKADLDQVETQNDNLRTQLQHERQETQTLQTQLDSKNESISTLETRITKKEQRITELESLVGTNDAAFGFSQNTIDQANELGNAVQESVAYVVSHLSGRSRASGTAWHLGEGYYLTNAHVVQNAESISLKLFSETEADIETASATLLGKDLSSDADIALLKSPNASQPRLTYTDATSMEKGDPLIQVGHPSGVGRWIIGLGPFAHYGTHQKESSYSPEFTSFLPNRTGNSGSPVFTLDGTVVGMTFGGSPHESSEVHAPDYPFTHYGEYRQETLHQHSRVFDQYIDKWK